MDHPERPDNTERLIASALGNVPRQAAPPRLAERVRRQVSIERMIAEQRRRFMRAAVLGVVFIAGVITGFGWLVTGAPLQWAARYVPGLLGWIDYYIAPMQAHWPVLVAFTLLLLAIPSGWTLAAVRRNIAA